MNDLAHRLLALLESRRGEYAPSNPEVDKYQHALQCATRAARNNEPADYVVMCLFHDVFGGFSPEQHGTMAAMMLAPYLSPRSLNACLFHVAAMAELRDPTAAFIDHNGTRVTHEYPEAMAFALQYDAPSFDPAYPTAKISDFYAAIEHVMPDERANAVVSGRLQ